MTRDEIERRVEEWIRVAYDLQMVVGFAISIHDAAKREDAAYCEAHPEDGPIELAEGIRATRVNK